MEGNRYPSLYNFYCCEETVMKATLFKTEIYLKAPFSSLSGLTGQSRTKAMDSPIKSGNDRSYEAGFTIIELMITMVVFVLAIAAVSSVFTGLLTQFKQQGKVAETSIEGAIGLEMLRQDIEKAGYGLPWVIPAGVTYSEAISSDPCGTTGTADPLTYNDSTANPPKAIVTGNNLCANGSDYLVIKAASIATNETAGKWTVLSPGNVKTTWLNADGSQSNDNVNKDNSGTTNNGAYLIVLSPGATTANSRTLVANGAAFAAQYSNTAAFAPADKTDVRIIYGLDPNTNPRMPFNRADYFISTSNPPSHCASGTGILEKVVVNQNGGGLTNFLPLLDCVASIQVIYQLDMDDNGTIGTQSKGDGSTVATSEGATTATVQATLASAALLRTRLKEVRVYVLAHEGQLDMNYTFTNFTSGTTIDVGEYGNGVSLGQSGTFLGRSVAMSGITNYLHYRWKIYTIVAKLPNLNK